MTIDYEPGRDLTMSFATPIARMRVKEAAEINPALQNLILENEAAQANDQRDNSGGWQSADDILDWPAPGLTVLKESIRDAITQMTKLTLGAETFDGRLILAAWANVMRHGAYHQPQTHAKFHWSGIYFVNAGQPDPDWPRSGTIEVQDPRERTEMTATPGNPFGQTTAIPAEAGTMIVFPSWLIHWVNPYYGQGERISVVFNGRVVQSRS